jgi:mannosyl-oligosaccharide alpha-1,2-mannosidase
LFILASANDVVILRNGWGAFIVDTSTTLALMEMWEELQLEIDHIIDGIDFTIAEGGVNTFETTIRYLGALVSLVGLIDSEIVPSTVLPQGARDRILAQAVTLADKLGPAFGSPTGMPWPLMNFTTGYPYAEAFEKRESGHVMIFPAHAGSNYLEYKLLSHLSGNPVYINRATRSWAPLVWNKYVEEWPGLVDGPMDLSDGAPVDKQRGWDRKHDSYYEYLLKAYILDPGDRYATKYRDRWVQAVQSLRDNLVFESSPLPGQQVGVLSIATYRNGWFINEMSHLACFAPGNVLLGGRYLGREDLVALGLGLLDGCHHAYDSTPLKIGPEVFSFMPSNASTKSYTYGPSGEKEREQLEKYGFWVANPAYKLRPEYVESLFYAYRITGDRKYQSWAWDAFTAIEKATRAEFGFAQVRNVMAEFKKENSENLDDECQSFWGAETLK